jgi:hypothetical protein
MLELGVFGGKYMTDGAGEFPDSWFRRAKLCAERHDPKLNYFGVNASKPLSYWKKKGWIGEGAGLVLRRETQVHGGRSAGGATCAGGERVV